MKIEIDQSGRIEDTSRLSVIAYSNDHQKSLLVTARDKKSIQSIFRKIGQPRIFIYKLFAVAIFVLVRNDLKKIDQIIVDREYMGYENLIKQFIIETAVRNNREIEREIIHFRSIGKKSKAHKTALTAFQAKRADIKLSSKDFFDAGFAK